MRLKTDTYIDLHQQALNVLRQIRHIQKRLTYARKRAETDANNWILRDWVPAWKRDINTLQQAYDNKCAQYTAIQLMLLQEVREQVAPHCITQAMPTYHPSRVRKVADDYREHPMGSL